MSLDSATALAIVHAADAHAKAGGLKPLGIAVLGADGGVRAALSQDNATPLRFEISRGKAAGSLQMGTNSRAIEDLANNRPAFFASLLHAAGGKIIAAAGGVLILDGNDRVLGAIGISGDTSDNDEGCAIAAIEQAGLRARR